MQKELSDIDESTLRRASMECTLAAVGIYTLDGFLVDCNGKYRQMLSKFCTEPEGNLLKTGLLPDHFDQRIQQGPVTFLAYFDQQNRPTPTFSGGQVNNVSITYIYVDGMPAGYNVSVMDITEQSRRAHQLAMYQRDIQYVLDNMSTGMVFLRPDYTVVWKGINAVYGPENGEKMYRVGTHCYEHFGLSAPCPGCPVTKAMQEQKTVETIFHDDSNDTYLHVKVNLMREDDHVIGYLMELIDVTELEKDKQKLQLAQRRAEKSESVKTVFMRNITHEVHTPLHALVGLSDLLYSAESHVLTRRERSQYLDMIRQNTHQLMNLMDDVILLSDLQSGRYVQKPTCVQVADFMQQCMASDRVKPQMDVELMVEIPGELPVTTLYTDANILKYILVSMITNSCKFTFRGSIVLSVNLRVDADGEWLSFAVTDTGCGVPEEHRSSIFESFYQGNKFQNGAGLGLSICRAAANLLDGRVYYDETYEGNGARFIFDYPLPLGSKLPTLDKLV